jgi:hypothetical protein
VCGRLAPLCASQKEAPKLIGDRPAPGTAMLGYDTIKENELADGHGNAPRFETGHFQYVEYMTNLSGQLTAYTKVSARNTARENSFEV